MPSTTAMVLLASLLFVTSHSSDKSTKSPFYRSEPLTSLPREQPSAPGPPQGSRRGSELAGKTASAPSCTSGSFRVSRAGARAYSRCCHSRRGRRPHYCSQRRGFATSPPEGETLRGEVHFSQRRRLEVRDAPSARQRSASDLDSKKRWTRVADRASC